MRAFSLLAILGILAGPAGAQEAAPPALKRVPITHTATLKGRDLFLNYCGACHGREGKGDGPAAPALKAAPTDLSTLARRNGGSFPAARMESVLRGQASIPSHGSAEMPTWGTLFASLSPGDGAAVQHRIRQLVKHLESLQAR